MTDMCIACHHTVDVSSEFSAFIFVDSMSHIGISALDLDFVLVDVKSPLVSSILELGSQLIVTISVVSITCVLALVYPNFSTYLYEFFHIHLMSSASADLFERGPDFIIVVAVACILASLLDFTLVQIAIPIKVTVAIDKETRYIQPIRFFFLFLSSLDHLLELVDKTVDIIHFKLRILP